MCEKQILINRCTSKADILRELGWPLNGSGYNKLDKWIFNNGLDISKIDGKKATIKSNTKYKKIVKICPVCYIEFSARKGSPKEGVTCSHSCSNTFFRSGTNNPNFKDGNGNYREIAFRTLQLKCEDCNIIEKSLLEVHHIDGNRLNNNVSNLEIVCPTHHKLRHLKIENGVYTYGAKYLTNRKSLTKIISIFKKTGKLL